MNEEARRIKLYVHPKISELIEAIQESSLLKSVKTKGTNLIKNHLPFTWLFFTIKFSITSNRSLRRRVLFKAHRGQHAALVL